MKVDWSQRNGGVGLGCLTVGIGSKEDTFEMWRRSDPMQFEHLGRSHVSQSTKQKYYDQSQYEFVSRWFDTDVRSISLCPVIFHLSQPSI